MANDQLPKKSGDQDFDHGGENNGNNILNVGQFHYHGNDLKELRRLAEVSPDLAERVVDSSDKQDERFNVSFRLGIVAALMLVMTAILGIVFLTIYGGILSTISLIAFILAISLLIRVILTGQWSETSWFGKLVSALVIKSIKCCKFRNGFWSAIAA